MRFLLGEVAEFDRERSVPVAVLVIPSPVHVCRDYGFQIEGSGFPGYDRERLTDVIAGLARDRELPVLDLFDLFAGPECASQFFATNPHWNPAGQQKAARATAEWIAAPPARRTASAR